jgi:predicted CXXCH cytochrome family protein
MTNVPTYGVGIVSGTKNIGRDLQNDHPVGVDYLVAGGGGAGLATMSSMTGYKFYAGEGGRTNSFECGSCHDVHGNDRATGAANSPFLRRNKSTMCSECHSAK